MFEFALDYGNTIVERTVLWNIPDDVEHKWCSRKVGVSASTIANY